MSAQALTPVERGEAPSSPRPLVEKLVDVMGDVERIPKRGWNDHHQYWYATESDVLDTMRVLLAKRKILIIPRVLSHGEEGTLTTLDITFTLVNTENPSDTIEIPWVGCGQDKNDKGAAKAITSALKYFLLRLFLVPTGDDPDANGKAEESPRETPRPRELTLTPRQQDDIFDAAKQAWSELTLPPGKGTATVLMLASRVAGKDVKALAEFPASKVKELYAEINQYPTKEK